MKPEKPELSINTTSIEIYQEPYLKKELEQAIDALNKQEKIISEINNKS